MDPNRGELLCVKLVALCRPYHLHLKMQSRMLRQHVHMLFASSLKYGAG